MICSGIVFVPNLIQILPDFTGWHVCNAQIVILWTAHDEGIIKKHIRKLVNTRKIRGFLIQEWFQTLEQTFRQD
jgi:hypothetical protein